MRKIVIIGASSLQLPLIVKANEKGFETHVFAWEDGAVAKKEAKYFYPISTTEKELILEECKKIQPVGIVSIGSDLAVTTVNYVARNLGLICNPEITDIVSTNKYAMRKVFEQNDIPSPNFVLVEAEIDWNDIEGLTYPLIVKATDRSGSRGVTRVNEKFELNAAIKEAKEQSFEKKAIIEEFIEGTEYSCECITFEGEHHLLAFTRKFTTGYPHYIEKGHLEPSDIPIEKQGEIKKLVFRALDALSIKNGASHSELKIKEDGTIWFIEIGSRMGGDRIGSDMVRISTGYDFVDMTLEVAVGKKPNFIKLCEPKVVVVRYIFDKTDFDLLMKIKKAYPDWIYYEDEIQTIDDSRIIHDSSVRYGQYILVFDDMEQAASYLPKDNS